MNLLRHFVLHRLNATFLLLGCQASCLTSLALCSRLAATTALFRLRVHFLALRSQRHDYVAPLLLRCEFNSPQIADFLSKSPQQINTADRTRLFSSSQHDGDLHLVSSGEEARNVTLLHFKIVFVNLEAETDFLDLSGALVSASFTCLDLFVVFELAVINELGYRRFGIGRHLD